MDLCSILQLAKDDLNREGFAFLVTGDSVVYSY